MSLSENSYRSRCPSCGFRLPLLHRIFLNAVKGHECSNCGALLVQSRTASVIQYLLLVLSLILIVIFVSNVFVGKGGWLYLFFWAITFLLLVIVKLKSSLSVSSGPGEKKESDAQKEGGPD